VCVQAAAENSDDDVAAASFSSSSSGAGAAAAAVGGAGTGAAQWSPTVVVKVGDGMWSPFELDGVLAMHRTKLLEALAESKLFKGYFKGVELLGECTVLVLKGALPAGQTLPSAADEAPAKVVALEGSMTLATAAKAGACKGEELFIRVHLPGPASGGEAVAGTDGELHRVPVDSLRHTPSPLCCASPGNSRAFSLPASGCSSR